MENKFLKIFTLLYNLITFFLVRSKYVQYCYFPNEQLLGFL